MTQSAAGSRPASSTATRTSSSPATARTSSSSACKGVSYEEISKAGGGIMSTVRATRAASDDDLVEQSLPRLHALITEGVTTVEIKSGYGLDLDTELQMLTHRAKARRADRRARPDHLSRPPRADRRVRQVRAATVAAMCGPVLRAIARRRPRRRGRRVLRSIAFTPQETRALLHRRARSASRSSSTPTNSPTPTAQRSPRNSARSRPTISNTPASRHRGDGEGGHGCRSATGRLLRPARDQARRSTTLREHKVPIAIATDCNPGTSPVVRLLTTMSMATTLFGLTPEEALAGVTRNGARALGLREEIGTLEVGKAADYVVWPIAHPAELSYWIGGFDPTTIVRAGRVPRPRLRARFAWRCSWQASAPRSCSAQTKIRQGETLMSDTTDAVPPAAPPAAAPADAAISSARNFALMLLLIVYISNYADRQILERARRPDHGAICRSPRPSSASCSGLAFALFYATLGIPIAAARRSHQPQMDLGRLARDLVGDDDARAVLPRVSGNSPIARVGVGVGEAGGSPPSHSMISDLFPAAQRGTALAIYSLGVPLGIFLGNIVGGQVGGDWGWRAAFYVLGLPGVLLAIYVAFALARAAARPGRRRHQGRREGAGARRSRALHVVAKVARAHDHRRDADHRRRLRRRDLDRRLPAVFARHAI